MMFREPSIGRCYSEAPQQVGKGVRSWITRGANFTVLISQAESGAVLTGTAKDEQFVYTLEGGVVVTAGVEQQTLGVEDLAIVPPGEWIIRFQQPGTLVQLVTADEDVAKAAPNAAHYAGGAPEVAPIVAWPEPVGGHALRRYSTLAAYARGGMVHAFRTRKLMMVPYARFLEPRDETQLSPHAHADFEQGSIALEGEWLHHLRVPWTANRRDWRPDVHLQIGSPSTTIIPAGVIHTSQGIAGEGMRLIDVFAPPRADFSERGWVDNAADYPMPTANGSAS
jgi:mannose-6-phosphate isomerase-like protein (cupin superfamily)